MPDAKLTDAKSNFNGRSFMVDVFFPARYIVREHREWFRDLTDKYPHMHQAVGDMIERHNVRPRDWQRLLLEHPHVSETDPARLAYTLDERAGLADRQTITTIGKYLNRHFDAPDHIIRDLAAQHASTSVFRFVHTTAEFVHAARNGPHSCMSWSDGHSYTCSDGVARHPYDVYDPQYGWHMALRLTDNRIDGRALCMKRPDNGHKYFVRSFKRSEHGGYSHSDEQLEAWLKAGGYEHEDAWHDGAQLAYYPTADGFLAPYLDGDTTNAALDRGRLFIDSDGDYSLQNTDGTPDGAERELCSCCGERYNSEDMTWVGPHEDEQVCEGCLDHGFTYVIGRNGYEYYVSNDDAVLVESQNNFYDINYLSRNNIVELANGDYEHMDNAVYIDSRDEYYSTDDEDVVYDEYNGCYQHIDDCTHTEDKGYVLSDDTWVCDATGSTYSDDIEPVEVDGNTYHPDHVPETADTGTDTEANTTEE